MYSRAIIASARACLEALESGSAKEIYITSSGLFLTEKAPEVQLSSGIMLKHSSRSSSEPLLSLLEEGKQAASVAVRHFTELMKKGEKFSIYRVEEYSRTIIFLHIAELRLLRQALSTLSAYKYNEVFNG